MLELPPLSLYIHVPWCVKKCPYCDFNSHAADGSLPERDYLDALLEDLGQDLAYVQGRALQSVFIGGGTPSLLSPAFYRELLARLADLVPLAEGAECTLEANPGTAEMERFADYRRVGINRLSLGIQSFDNRFLHALGRIHDSRQAEHAIGLCRQAGFENFNLDIMYGLPDQSPAEAMTDLQQALAHAPPHLSWYQLTLEPNTAFYSQPPPLPDEDTIAEVMTGGLHRLAMAGLQRYEVSAFARPGRQSAHNRNYWLFGDYLGIGAGASGKVTLPGEGRLLRTRKVRQPGHYLARRGQRFLAEAQHIDADSLALEFLMNALRLPEGFAIATFEGRTGQSFSSIRKKLEYLQAEGLLQLSESHVTPTEKGMLFTNSVLEHFL